MKVNILKSDNNKPLIWIKTEEYNNLKKCFLEIAEKNLWYKSLK